MKFIKSILALVGLIVIGLLVFSHCSSPKVPEYQDQGRNPGFATVPEDQATAAPTPSATPEPTAAVADPTAVQFTAFVTEDTPPVGFSTDTTRSEHPTFDVTCQDLVCSAERVHPQDQLDGFAENFIAKVLTETYTRALEAADPTDAQSVLDTFNDALTELGSVTYLNNGWPSEGQQPDGGSTYFVTVTEPASTVQ